MNSIECQDIIENHKKKGRTLKLYIFFIAIYIKRLYIEKRVHNFQLQLNLLNVLNRRVWMEKSKLNQEKTIFKGSDKNHNYVDLLQVQV